MIARHLYVHVPFCARRCSYCDFAIAVRRATPVREYLRALERELALAAREGPLATLYLGGGTPSRLGAEGVADLARLVKPGADLEEFTIEANPDDVTVAAARAWAEAGVNRVSLGAQSFDPAALAWMHRTHDAAAIGAAVRTVRRAGIARLSLDLIFALPDQLRRNWRSDLDRAIALEPDHISLYGLTVEPGTALARWIARGQSGPVDERRYEQEYLLAHEVLAAAGFVFYEVSNAARPGCEARHNRAYWQLAPYLGVGPAAHSFDGSSRWWNEAAYAAWLRRVNAGERPVAAREVLNPEQQRLERSYLALRTREGLELDEALAAKVEPWVRAGWAQVVRRDDGLAASPTTGSHAQESSEGPSHGPTAPRPYRLHLTPQGWLRLDELVATL